MHAQPPHVGVRMRSMKRRGPGASDSSDTSTSSSTTPPAKRPRTRGPVSHSSSQHSSVGRRAAASRRTGRDLLSPLSDELLIRILAFLPLQHLLATAPVSRRFHRLSEDSQLWKALYYARFVLPRAMRIPGFRDSYGTGAQQSERSHKLHYMGRQTLWADGRRGGVVRGKRAKTSHDGRLDLNKEARHERVEWKKQYKLRHNWARGKCAVEELKLSLDDEDLVESDEGGKLLVKVIEGLAVTVDRLGGLRAWDLKTRALVAQSTLRVGDDAVSPSCIAIDDQHMGRNAIDIAVGFFDGSFGVWRLDTATKHVDIRYRHEKSSNGQLLAMAYSNPFLLTATESVLISLYTFDVEGIRKAAPDNGRDTASENDTDRNTKSGSRRSRSSEDMPLNDIDPKTGRASLDTDQIALPSPYLLTSLKSHTSRPPLVLSIRRTANTTIASIAYTFETRQGYSIGIQDLHIRHPASGSAAAPDISATRLAYTQPVSTGPASHTPITPPRTPFRSQMVDSEITGSATTASDRAHDAGPTSLCYTHPYVLATLPDNTLILHMCTSNESSLSLSPGIRLWGHTSGISDAEITARGRAVSVSTKGEEMRVWELEGRSSAAQSRSVEIRPEAPGPTTGTETTLDVLPRTNKWEERRNWVGFDDEMVIVLKESEAGGNSLMVYDFT